MPVTSPIAYAGGTVAVSASVPATNDTSGFGALSYTSLPGILAFDPPGDTAPLIVLDLLSGRSVNANDVVYGQALNFTLLYIAADPGQVIVLANANGTQNCSIRFTDPDGKLTYVCGVFNSVTDMAARGKGNAKGYKGVFAVNTPTIRT